MMAIPLAGIDDVENAMGRTLTDDERKRVGHILQKASELFRQEAGQQFTPGVSTARLKVNGGDVVLRQRPVTAVTQVVDDDGHDVPYRQIRPHLLRTGLGSHEHVTVTYQHGDLLVPERVRLTIADIARTILSIAPEAVTGVTQIAETTGPFSDNTSYATWAQGGKTDLSNADKAVARSFRVRVPTVWVGRT